VFITDTSIHKTKRQREVKRNLSKTNMKRKEKEKAPRRK